MKLVRNVVLVAGFGCTALGLGNAMVAQEPEAAPPKAAPPAAAQPAKSAEQWIADLGNESYKVRLQAEKELRQLGKAALPSLRAAAERTDDSEVQWRAKRLVRQIESGKTEALQKRQSRTSADGGQDPQFLFRRWPILGGGFPEDVRTRFESLFEQMERDFGLDVPRARFFDDEFFRDLQQQIEAGGGVSQGMTMKVGPDGVRVEVKQKNDKGEVEEKVYEAPDLEAFRQQYPGVLEKNGLGMQLWLGGSQGLQAPQLLRPRRDFDAFVVPRQRAMNQQPAEAGEPAAVPPSDQRLGVVIRPEIAADLREHLGLEEGTGLMVESVQPGTLAESLGLQRGDIVVRIGSQTIGSANDVQQALGAIEPNAAVEVHFLRKGVEKTATTNKAAPESKPAPDSKPAPQTKPAERLERRAKKGESVR